MDKTGRQLDSSGISPSARSCANRATHPHPGARTPVPRFFLYGEPLRELEEGFVHVETIPDRSRLYDWKISPHVHRDLDQLLLVTAGHGQMRVETRNETFAAPALLIVPATVVHAFEFERETAGFVVSIGASSLGEVVARERELTSVFAAAAAISLISADREMADLAEAAAQLRRETVWTAAARHLAVEARLVILLVGVLRALAHHGPAGGPRRGPRAALVTRFRDLLDARFRSGWTVTQYAGELGVGPERLRAACLEMTGKPPMRLVHDRLLLEAKRLLTYTDLTVAETAYQLGFGDPAYFSRFFSEHVGEPPVVFRRRTARSAPVPTP